MLRRNFNITVTLPTERRRKPGLYKVRQQCYKLKQSDIVRLIDDEKASVVTNDRKLCRLFIGERNTWVSYLKVVAIDR